MYTCVFKIYAVTFTAKFLPKYTHTWVDVCFFDTALHCISTKQHWLITRVFDKVILSIEGHQTIYIYIIYIYIILEYISQVDRSLWLKCCSSRLLRCWNKQNSVFTSERKTTFQEDLAYLSLEGHNTPTQWSLMKKSPPNLEHHFFSRTW